MTVFSPGNNKNQEKTLQCIPPPPRNTSGEKCNICTSHLLLFRPAHWAICQEAKRNSSSLPLYVGSERWTRWVGGLAGRSPGATHQPGCTTLCSAFHLQHLTCHTCVPLIFQRSGFGFSRLKLNYIWFVLLWSSACCRCWPLWQGEVLAH